MNVGFKYCGGCNPTYNRKDFLNNLMSKHRDVHFTIAEENIFYDIVLIINGCIRACASHEKLNGRIKLFVNSQDVFNKIEKFISNYKNDINGGFANESSNM